MALTEEILLSRRERKKRETRKRILGAAMALMEKAPYDEVRIEDICATADVANATFFLHFENKSALVLAFNEEVANKIAQQLPQAPATSAEQLKRVLSVYLQEWGNHRHLMRQIVLEFISQSSSTSNFNEVSPGLLDLIKKIIHEGQVAGEFSLSIEPETVALALVAGWNAIAIAWAKSGDTKHAADAHWQTLELYLAGLKHHEPLERL